MRLYVPVETVARELDAKLLLSLFATQRGLSVVLGNRALLSNTIHRFEPGIFLSHNFDRGRRRLLRIVRDLGYKVVAWDEEGLVWLSPEVYRKRRVDPGTIRLVDTIYSWGRQHSQALEPLASPAGVAIVQTGNPRADLLRPEMRALYRGRCQRLRAELGRFVLVVSNFGWLNYALARNTSAMSDDDAVAAMARRSGHSHSFLKFRLAVFRAFVDMLPKLSASFPDRKIVIRPHPSEDPSNWVDAARGLANVQVRYDDELVPWLLSANAIVHNGCTTGVEAALLGRTPIMYRPVDGGAFEITQPLSVSVEARTPDALLAAVADNGGDHSRGDEIARSLSSLVSGLTGTLCAQTIAAALAERSDAGGTSHPRLRRMAGQAKSITRRFEKSLSALTERSPSHPAYIARKFPAMSATHIQRRVRQLATLLDRPVPAVGEISDRIFEIQPAE